jgi:hypothetical protein
LNNSQQLNYASLKAGQHRLSRPLGASFGWTKKKTRVENIKLEYIK